MAAVRKLFSSIGKQVGNSAEDIKEMIEKYLNSPSKQPKTFTPSPSLATFLNPPVVTPILTPEPPTIIYPTTTTEAILAEQRKYLREQSLRAYVLLYWKKKAGDEDAGDDDVEKEEEMRRVIRMLLQPVEDARTLQLIRSISMREDKTISNNNE